MANNTINEQHDEHHRDEYRKKKKEKKEKNGRTHRNDTIPNFNVSMDKRVNKNEIISRLPTIKSTMPTI